MSVVSWLETQKGCAHCGSWQRLESSLCTHCHKRLQVHQAAEKWYRPVHMPFLGKSTLFKSKSSGFLADLVSSAKNARNKTFFRWSALQIALALKIHGAPYDQSYCVVPCPPSAEKQKDHAYWFGFYLAEFMGLSFCPDVLNWQDYSPQKELSLAQRAGRRFKESSNIFRTQNVFFADDILTSGFTALAAYRALEKPKNFIALTAVYQLPNRQL